MAKATKNDSAAESTKSAGRPAGAKTQDLPTTDRVLPACPYCGNREAAEVLRTEPVQEYAGVTKDGVPYRRIHRRRVRCVNPDCRRVRIEQTFE
jgi:hypothetical protein